MSDGSLSQDEIDALLQGSSGFDFDAAPKAPAANLSDADVQAFAAMVQKSVDTQASNLAMVVNKAVSIGQATADIQMPGGLGALMPNDLAIIKIPLQGGAGSEHFYAVEENIALAIAGPMQGLDQAEFNDAAVNALQEAFNNLTGPLLTTLSGEAGANWSPASPSGSIGTGSSISSDTGSMVRVSYPVQIDGQNLGSIYEFFDGALIKELVAGGGANGLSSGSGGLSADDPMASFIDSAGQPQAAAPQGGAMGSMGMMGGGQGMMQQPMMGGGQQMMQQPMMPGGMMGGPQVQGVQYPSFQAPQGPGPDQGNISLLMDVYMEMTVELGRTRKPIKEILGMGEGTIIELDKLAGEAVDILVNHKLIAKGEVVVIDENFGVRVTEIVSPLERMNNMT